MKPVHTWNDLQQFGINCLTGEADVYSLRLLCDVNEDGRELITDYLGIMRLGLHPNWNSTVDGQPAVGSVMLHRDSLQQVAIFAMFRAGALAVVTGTHGTNPVVEQDKLELYEQMVARRDSGARLIRNPTAHATAPREGSRNVHAATGRAT